MNTKQEHVWYSNEAEVTTAKEVILRKERGEKEMDESEIFDLMKERW